MLKSKVISNNNSYVLLYHIKKSCYVLYTVEIGAFKMCIFIGLAKIDIM